MHYPGNPLVPNIWTALSEVITVIAALLIVAVIIGLIVLLVRFLLVGTRAAELYLERNATTASIPVVSAPPAPSAPASAPEPTAAPEPTVVADEPVIAPRTTTPRARKPKLPPTE
jgi:hypothetical protein